MAKAKIIWKDQGVNLNPDKLPPDIAKEHAALRKLFEQVAKVKASLEGKVETWLLANASRIPEAAADKLGLTADGFEPGTVRKFGYRGGIIVASVPGSRSVAADAIDMVA